MASFVAGQIMDDVSSKVGGAFSGDKNTSSSSSSSKPSESAVENGIDWSVRTWPKLLPVIHYSPNDDKLSGDAIRLATRMERGVYLFAVVLIWNIISTIITVAGGARSGIDIFTAFLWCIFGNLLSIAAFYIGYKSVAAQLARWKLVYFGVSGVLLLLMLIASITDTGNWHGWAIFGDVHSTDTFAGGMYAMAGMDSVSLTAACAYGGWLVYKFYAYDVLTKKDKSGSRHGQSNAGSEAGQPPAAARSSRGSSGSGDLEAGTAATAGADAAAGKQKTGWSRFF